MLKNELSHDRNKKIIRFLYLRLLFWIIIFVKIIAGFLFASEFLTNLFYPFIDHFINYGPSSTYESFYFSGKENSFPYPVLMLYITGFFKFFFSNDNILSSWDLGLIRIPILLADFAILLVLCRWLKKTSTTSNFLLLVKSYSILHKLSSRSVRYNSYSFSNYFFVFYFQKELVDKFSFLLLLPFSANQIL